MIYDNLTKLIGKTPIVHYDTINHNRLYLKLEKFNLGGSIKDRIALSMVEDLIAKNEIQGKTIVEATSGNTGIGLALIGAIKKIPVIIFMPAGSSKERCEIMQAYGAKVIFTTAALGMAGAIDKAEEYAKDPQYIFIRQFENTANPGAHYQNTALEIIEDFPQGLDYLVTGIGTAGTIKGLYDQMHPRFPQLQFVGVEPLESAVLTGGQPQAHQIPGIGAGFVPKFFPVGKTKIEDISSHAAQSKARALAKGGLFLGISSAACVVAAEKIAQTTTGKSILIMAADGGERYISSGVFNDE